jgi:transposase InsO family protein
MSWLTAQEIADRRLPGLPSTGRGVNALARREGWQAKVSPTGEALARTRPGRGGGIEYHVSLLPPAARARAEAAEKPEAPSTSRLRRAPPSPPRGEGPAPVEPEGLNSAALVRRDARLWALAAADRHFARAGRLGRKAADALFCRGWADNADAPDWVRSALPSLSPRSLARWRALRAAGRWHDLAGRRGSGARAVLAVAKDGAVALHIGGLLAARPFLSAMHVRDLVEAEFGAVLQTPAGEAPLPGARAFQAFVKAWKAEHGAALSRHLDPDGWKGRARLTGSDAYAAIERPNELWEIDASPADALCTDGRHSVYVVVDVATRRMLALVSKTARTAAVLALVRRAILQWGVPETLRTDNGSDFKAHAFVRALHSLGIVHDMTKPFAPEDKGMVERAIGTLQRGLMPLLPGFAGHSVAQRKVIEGRKSFAARLGEDDGQAFAVEMSSGELQRAIDAWAADKYGHSPHRGLGGLTPFAKAAAFKGTIRRVENVRALDLLLSPVSDGDAWRTVSKQGVRLGGVFYISPRLSAGRRVFLRQDPDDMGRVYAFESESGAFVAEAVNPGLAGIDPAAAVAAARAEQARLIREETAAIRAEARKIKPRDMAEKVLRLAAEKAGKVAAFPGRHEAHETAAMRAAGEALDFGRPGAGTPTPGPSPQGGGEENVRRLPESAKQRFRRALAVRAALRAGEAVDGEAARWLGGYEQTAEFKAHASMLADFGEEWLKA